MRAYEGYPITLHCVATGDPTPTIQWDRNNKYINPVNNSRFTVCVCGGCVRVCVRTRVTRSLYTAWRRETRPRPYSGTETTNTSTLLITAGSRWVCACVWRVCACMRAYEGYPITLHCVATGDPTPTIQWDRNNKYINPVNNSRFTVSVCVCGGCVRVCVCTRVTRSLYTVWRRETRPRPYSGTETTNTSTLLITAGSRWVCVFVWSVYACAWGLPDHSTLCSDGRPDPGHTVGQKQQIHQPC